MGEKKKKIRQLALNATEDEVVLFERIKQYYHRGTDIDTLRFLIQKESEEILSLNMPIGI